jgi:hypothetical protein
MRPTQRGLDFTGDHSKGSIGGPMIKGVSDTPTAILISLKPAGFQMVPKRQLSEAEVAAFKNVLRCYAPGATNDDALNEVMSQRQGLQ